MERSASLYGGQDANPRTRQSIAEGHNRKVSPVATASSVTFRRKSKVGSPSGSSAREPVGSEKPPISGEGSQFADQMAQRLANAHRDDTNWDASPFGPPGSPGVGGAAEFADSQRESSAGRRARKSIKREELNLKESDVSPFTTEMAQRFANAHRDDTNWDASPFGPPGSPGVGSVRQFAQSQPNNIFVSLQGEASRRGQSNSRETSAGRRTKRAEKERELNLKESDVSPFTTEMAHRFAKSHRGDKSWVASPFGPPGSPGVGASSAGPPAQKDRSKSAAQRDQKRTGSRFVMEGNEKRSPEPTKSDTRSAISSSEADAPSLRGDLRSVSAERREDKLRIVSAERREGKSITRPSKAPFTSTLSDGVSSKTSTSQDTSQTKSNYGESVAEDGSTVRFCHGAPSVPYTRLYKCFADEQCHIYRLVDEKTETWAYFNDTTDLELTAQIFIGDKSKFKCLDDASLPWSKEKNHFVGTFVVPPVSTKKLLSGIVKTHHIAYTAAPKNEVE